MRTRYCERFGKLRPYQGKANAFISPACGLLLVLILLMAVNLQAPAFAGEDANQPVEAKGDAPIESLSKWPETLKAMRSELPDEVRIDMIIRILEKEPIQLSLARLDEYNMYTWGGEWIFYEKRTYGMDDIPLKPGVCRKDMICIMSNRRFLKLMEELGMLPRAKAGELVGKDIVSTLSLYRKLWDEQMECTDQVKKVQYRDPNKPTRALLAYNIHGRPTLLGVRSKMLALLAIAGNLQLQEARSGVMQVIDLAIEQRNEFYNNPVYFESAAAHMLVEASLYNRQILATAALGTSVEFSAQEAIVKAAGCSFKSEKVQRYTEIITRYGRLSHEYEIMKNPPEGSLTVRYLEPISDSQFGLIINAIGKAKVK